MIGHSGHAPTNPYAPEPVGCCDRCGFLYPLAALREQMRWAGTAVVGTGLLVCPRDLDVLQQNGVRTIHFGPEPKPLRNARPSPLWGKQAPVPVQFVLDDPDADRLDIDLLGDGTTPPASTHTAPLDEFDLDGTQLA